MKRLVHRNANVQIYSLTLSDALSKNCGEIAHQELASRSFTQTLQRIVTDRNTHDTVKKKSISLIKEWKSEWGNDESLGLIRETMESLKTAGFSFRDERDAAPVEPSSEQLRAEDEELRKVLELSLQDQGGRAGYTASQPTAAASSSSRAPIAAATTTTSSYAPSQPQQASNWLTSTTYQPSSSNNSSQQHANAATSSSTSTAATSTTQPIASRVRALYDFTPTESGELAFRKGDVLRVLDSVYEHWWRGEINGEVGIFPVNFVEVLPDPTPADVQREAEMEAKIFAQANNIDRLLSKLRGLDPARDNLAEDEELQELYQSSLSMRPKIVKLIDRYNLKVTELRSMNEKFVRARSTFDAMMEQSLAKYNPGAQSVDYTNQRPEYGYAPAQSQGYPQTQAGAVPQQTPAYRTQQQQQQPSIGGEPPMHGYAQQQQQPGAPPPQQPQSQEYAQAWAAWYAQNGYQQPPQSGQQPGMIPSHSASSLNNAPPQSETIVAPPPNVNDPAYSQWYYSQQQHQQQTSQEGNFQGATSNALLQPSSNYDYSNANDSNALHDQDKRALFERARAEADAYHRAHQQHATGNNEELHLQ